MANRDDGRSETLRRDETKAIAMTGREVRGGGTMASEAAIGENARADSDYSCRVAGQAGS